MAMQLAPEGRYYGKIIKQDIYSTKEENGTPFLGFDVLLTKKDNEVGKPEDLELPLKRRFSLWLNAKNVKNTFSSLAFLGYDKRDIAPLNPWHDEHISLSGTEVALDISHQENPKTGDMQESIWLSRSKKPLDKESSASVLAQAAEMFAAYYDDRMEKKVSKLSPEELAAEVKRAEEKAKQGETFNPFEFDKTPEDFNKELPMDGLPY